MLFTFDTSTQRDSSRFVPILNPVCWSVMRVRPCGSKPSSLLCFVKDTSCESWVFFPEPWPPVDRSCTHKRSCWTRTHSMRHVCRCHATRKAFPGTKQIFGKSWIYKATWKESRGRHLFLAGNRPRALIQTKILRVSALGKHCNVSPIWHAYLIEFNFRRSKGMSLEWIYQCNSMYPMSHTLLLNRYTRRPSCAFIISIRPNARILFFFCSFIFCPLLKVCFQITILIHRYSSVCSLAHNHSHQYA